MLVKRPALPFLHPVTLLATWFGSGLLPKAPGTWGSLGALICAWPLLAIGGSALLLGACIFVFFVGIWASQRYADALDLDDPGEVVIDEVAGQWLSLLPLGTLSTLEPSLETFVMGFVFFRLFDIWKPWPVGFLDRRLKGGLGIMVDDIVAGIYAAASLLLLFWALAWLGFAGEGL